MKREFFRYRLAFALHLRPVYAIRLYQWAKRWQFAAKRRITVEELRVVPGTLELGKHGKVVKVLLKQYKHLKSRAIKQAVAEINRQTDIEISFLEHKVSGNKTVEALTFRIRINSKAGELESVPLPPATQTESGLEDQEEMERVVGKAVADFGLSRNQEKFVRKCLDQEGLEYVNEKVAVIRSKEYKNAAAAFLSALRDDWKLPVKLKKGTGRPTGAGEPDNSSGHAHGGGSQGRLSRVARATEQVRIKLFRTARRQISRWPPQWEIPKTPSLRPVECGRRLPGSATGPHSLPTVTVPARSRPKISAD